MKILVAGATGFIGSAFRKAALSHGHAIAALFRGSTPTAVDGNEGGRIEWIEGTLAEMPWRAIEAFQPEACVHTAWITTPGVYLDSPANKEYLHWSLQLGKTLRQIGVSRLAVFGTCFDTKDAASHA